MQTAYCINLCVHGHHVSDHPQIVDQIFKRENALFWDRKYSLKLINPLSPTIKSSGLSGFNFNLMLSVAQSWQETIRSPANLTKIEKEGA